jgi:hypothetical protein
MDVPNGTNFSFRKGGAMLVRKCFLVVAIIFLLVPSMVSADSVDFRFNGTITYGGILANVGSQITGTFSYDASAVPWYSSTGLAIYSFPSDPGFSAYVAGHTVTANHLGVHVWNYQGGNVEDMVDISGGYPVSVDGGLYPNGSFGFRLASKPGNTSVLTGTALPSFFDVTKFDAGPTLNYGWLQKDGAPGGTLLQFSIDSITVPATVPIPSAAILMASGLLTIGGVLRRSSRCGRV